MSDDDLLIQCDAVLSLIRHRESHSLSAQTVQDLDDLLRPLRTATNRIIRARRAAGSREGGAE